MASRITKEEYRDLKLIMDTGRSLKESASSIGMSYNRATYIIKKRKNRSLKEKIMDFFGFTYE